MAVQEKQKVLIITYYWPPAGGPGVQRWLKFVKYLPDFGIHPIVYIPDNPNYPITDNSLTKEIPQEVTILKQPIKEPYKYAALLSKKSSKTISSGVIPREEQQSIIQKALLYIRGNLFIPDARKSWVQPSVTFLSEYIKKENIKTVVTSGPPHSLHLIGMQLKKQLGINWLADFRDPWTTIGYHKKLKLTAAASKKHETMEREVLNAADQIIVTSENTKKEFAQKTDRAITVITNGYDHEQLSKTKKDTAFSVAHIGSLLSGRDPQILWQVIGELIEEDPEFKKDFKLRLIGVVSDDVLQHIFENIPKANVAIEGYVSHQQALIYQRQSQLLALIEIDSADTKAIIPGKLFEYLIAQTPIIAFGPKDSDVERIIASTNTGQYFNYHEAEVFKNYLKSCYQKYKEGSLASFPVGLQQYSRKALTQKLSTLLASFS